MSVYDSESRSFGDSAMPEAEMILGQFFQTNEYVTEDLERNTDLTTIYIKPWKVGLRARGRDMKEIYPNDVTIRFSMASGWETEFSKIMHYGDFLFYHFLNLTQEEWKKGNHDTHIIDWCIGDYFWFRQFFSDMSTPKRKEWIFNHLKGNFREGDSSFLAFGRDEIPGFIVAEAKDWLPVQVQTWIMPKTNQPRINRAVDF